MVVLRALPAVFVVAAALVAGLGARLSAGGGAERGPVIVIAPPFGDAEALIKAAGGRPLFPVSGFAVGFSENAEFSERLRELGALAVIQAGGFCGTNAEAALFQEDT